MMDLLTIHALAENARREAKRNAREPYVFTLEERARFGNVPFGEIKEWNDRERTAPLRHIPNFGDYRPKGWELVMSYGFGVAGEFAFTIGAFAELVAASDPLHGWAMIEESQFQIYLGEFAKVQS